MNLSKTNLSKTVAIVQSSYIPWKGYFDLINSVDEFVLYDDMQYTRRDWRNRNRIKSLAGSKWLTLAVEVKGKYSQKINQTLVADPDWATQHWNKLANAYGKAPFFEQCRGMVHDWYSQAAHSIRLSDINRFFIVKICDFLAITTKISSSSDYRLTDGKSERLLRLCLDTGADTYLSGPSAREYLNVEMFNQRGVAVQWMDYGDYKTYPQLSDEFEHAVTILDVIFNCGPRSREYVTRAPRT